MSDNDTRQLHIMLVEDTPEHADIIMRSLDMIEGKPSVTWSKDGSDALELLSKQKVPTCLPDLILLDIKMPKIDGFQVLSSIKGDELLRVIPVIMLSTTTRQEEILRCYGLGANSYIVKPIGFRELVEVMKEVGKYWGSVNQRPFA
jgi:CheY-like chemotaxis protein